MQTRLLSEVLNVQLHIFKHSGTIEGKVEVTPNLVSTGLKEKFSSAINCNLNQAIAE